MKIVRVSNELGGGDRKRADSELQHLESLGGVFGFEVGSVGGVDGEHALPAGGEAACSL